MSEPERPEALRTESERRPEGPRAPLRGARIAVAIAVGGLAVAVGAGATLAASAASSIGGRGLTAAQATDAAAAAAPTPTTSAEASEPSAPPTAATTASTVQAPDPALVAKYHTTQFASLDPIPLYDATNELADIPWITPDQERYPGEGEQLKTVIQAQLITARCMAGQGFDYTFTPHWLRPASLPTVTHLTESAEWREAWGECSNSADREMGLVADGN